MSKDAISTIIKPELELTWLDPTVPDAPHPRLSMLPCLCLQAGQIEKSIGRPGVQEWSRMPGHLPPLPSSHHHSLSPTPTSFSGGFSPHGIIQFH